MFVILDLPLYRQVRTSSQEFAGIKTVCTGICVQYHSTMYQEEKVHNLNIIRGENIKYGYVILPLITLVSSIARSTLILTIAMQSHSDGLSQPILLCLSATTSHLWKRSLACVSVCVSVRICNVYTSVSKHLLTFRHGASFV